MGNQGPDLCWPNRIRSHPPCLRNYDACQKALQNEANNQIPSSRHPRWLYCRNRSLARKMMERNFFFILNLNWHVNPIKRKNKITPVKELVYFICSYRITVVCQDFCKWLINKRIYKLLESLESSHSIASSWEDSWLSWVVLLLPCFGLLKTSWITRELRRMTCRLRDFSTFSTSGHFRFLWNFFSI